MQECHQDALEAARRFAVEFIEPAAARNEIERRPPRELFSAAASAGLTGLMVPTELGGRGLSVSATTQVMEVLAAADLATTFPLVVHNNVARTLATRAEDALRARYLPGMLTGEHIGAFLLTEPGAGSDAAAITTTARATRDMWQIDGEKAWVTNATSANLLCVYAQAGQPGHHQGIACLLVEADAEGVTRLPAYHLLGGHAIGAGGFRFDACQVPESQLLFAPGEGFKAALAGIDLARAMVANMCVGMLTRSLEYAIDYAQQREAFGRPIAQRQGLQWALAEVATELRAAQLMARSAAQALDDDGGGRAVLEAAHAKKYATRAAMKGIEQCMQVMGANGLRHDHPLARHLACAKIAHYLDGTSEIQNVVISRELFALRGSPSPAGSRDLAGSR